MCVAASEQPQLWHQPGDSYSACGRFRSKLNPGAPACPDSRPVATMPPARARLAGFLEASIDTAQFPSLERQRSDRSVASQRPSAFESSRVRPKWVLGRPPAHFPDEPYFQGSLRSCLPAGAPEPGRAQMQELWGLSPADEHLRYNLHAAQCGSGRCFEAVIISVAISTGKVRAHPRWSSSCNSLPFHHPTIFLMSGSRKFEVAPAI